MYCEKQYLKKRKQTINLHKCVYRDVRVKKKRKRLLQEAQWTKEMDEKSDEKTQDKAKSDTDEEKDTIGIDDESQGDSSESKVKRGRKSKVVTN